MTTPVESVLVHVTNAHELKPEARPDKPRDIEVNTKTFTLKTAQTSDPVDSAIQRILDRDPARVQAIISVAIGTVYLCHSKAQAQAAAGDSSGAGTAASFPGSGSVTNPGAFASIASTAAVPAGTYQVTATVYLSGTVTAADANNMRIVGPGMSNVIIDYPGVANTPVTISATVTTTASGSITVQAIGAASGAAAVYNASIEVTPASATGIGGAQDGFLVTAGQPIPPLLTTDPLWAVVPSDKAGGGALVSVIAERRRA